MLLYLHAFRCVVVLGLARVAALRSRLLVVVLVLVLVLARALVVASRGVKLNGRRFWGDLVSLHCCY